MNVITRFAPSPTGMLHIGNARTALINWLYAKAHGGKFILRIDDTDLERSKPEYEKAIIQDLKWLGLTWDDTFSQSSRLDKYNLVKEQLIKSGRLYECYETAEELDVKRKLQLAAHKPPIYDRAALKLTEQQKNRFKVERRRPHYRFRMRDAPIKWNDIVNGPMSYESSNIGDPILVRGDGSMTYMICSTVDDIEYNISHILRGEDHLTNTAIQIQIFEALSSSLPAFGHLSLVHQREGKISKRVGGFEISSLRDDEGIEAMTINSFFATIGTSEPVKILNNMKELTDNFNITKFSKSPTTYLPEELERLNHKFVISLEYKDIKDRLIEMGCAQITEDFWLAVRPNLQKLKEIKDWWKICNHNPVIEGLDKNFLAEAAVLLPSDLTVDSWAQWTKLVSAKTGKLGKELFMPLRLALTGMDHGPELKNLLPLIGRERILERLG